MQLLIAQRLQMSDTHRPRINPICGGRRMATPSALGENAPSK